MKKFKEMVENILTEKEENIRVFASTKMKAYDSIDIPVLSIKKRYKTKKASSGTSDWKYVPVDVEIDGKVKRMFVWPEGYFNGEK